MCSNRSGSPALVRGCHGNSQGGMQQRAQLCRALVHDPAILLLDEPFGALDAFSREELWAVLQALWIERRFTVILVTHELREAAYLADKVHVMCARPGSVTANCAVPFSRPRSLETTFAPDFVALVHDLRSSMVRRQHDAEHSSSRWHLGRPRSC